MPTRIAVVDHSPHHLRLFQEYLGKKGFDVSAHADDEQGLDEISERAPAAIILGNLNGLSIEEWNFLLALRSRPTTSATPVILATTAPSLVEHSDLYARQDNLYLLAKPFDVHTLLVRIETALEGDANPPDDSIL
jgi:DNA-binding response OmpR family regulator